MKKASNIGEYFGTIQQSTVEGWKKHLKTDKYSNHMALDEFYKDIVELVDSLIEDYQGVEGKVENLKNLMDGEEMGTIEYLEELREFVKGGQKEFLKDSEFKSDVDSILSLIDSTLYKLKELKEGEDHGYTYPHLVPLSEYLTSKFE